MVTLGGGATQGAAAVSEGNQVQPYVLAVLLCDTIIRDAETGKTTLVGLFDVVTAVAFPAVQQFGIYIKLTDAQGPYMIRLEYVDLAGDRIIESHEVGPIEVADRLAPTELTLVIAARVPAAGSYEFRVYANNAYLARAPFEAAVLDGSGGRSS